VPNAGDLCGRARICRGSRSSTCCRSPGRDQDRSHALSAMRAFDDLQLQGDWDAQPLRDQWTLWPDLRFAFERFAALTVEATAAGASGEVLEVAAAEGIHACALRARGLAARILEPSPKMLQLARARQRRAGVVVPLVRGVAEAAPFRDASFERVLCDSALD